ncbi:MAG: pseudouridine synthase [Mariprofundaceae bacterium]|nr:pseudouridine synthase [Mariprofundaceae bacterium]
MTAATTERLDRLLSRLGYCSRREVKSWIKQGLIHIDGANAVSAAIRVSPGLVSVNGEALDHPDGLTLIYHKPLGSVCSRDDHGRLIYADFPERWLRRKPPLASIGRLDKDTAGLLILTDNGQLNHRLSSPKHHIARTYRVTLDRPLADDVQALFASGELMLDGDERPCLAAELRILGEKEAELTLHEGRYHQARRMFAAIGNHVAALTRIRLGAMSLADTGLSAGEFRCISPESLLAWIERGKPA